MENYVEGFISAFLGAFQWTWRSILFEVPWYKNFFWGIILLSLTVWILELLFPWRKQQSAFRKDFGLDVFYLFFNFFIFSIAISGCYRMISLFFAQRGLHPQSFMVVDITQWSAGLQLFVFFVLLDFVQWITHILLHKYDFLWQFHKIHHSVKEMGFAAHMRYHWMENVLYKPFKTLALMLLGGFEPEQAFIVHFITIAIGHLNHANIKINWGPLRYVLNSPVMHLHHHAYHLPPGKFGVNFGISLSVWDYLFNTHHVPNENGQLPLGYPGDENLPQGFWKQMIYGFSRRSSSD